jgi:dihydroneopterin aldolase
VSDRIVLRGLRLWAHVGVLESERLLGQWFELDAWFEADLTIAGRSDRLGDSLDYVQAVTAARRVAADLCCHTLEHFSERLLEAFTAIYGPRPMGLELRKCAAPIPGFDGSVAVCRSRP